MIHERSKFKKNTPRFKYPHTYENVDHEYAKFLFSFKLPATVVYEKGLFLSLREIDSGLLNYDHNHGVLASR